MKKVILLSIVPLAMLMADFTLMGEQLTPTNEPVAEPAPTPTPVPEPTPTPTPIPPPAVSGVIPISAERIWYDTYDAGDVIERVAYTATMPQFFPQTAHNPFPSAGVNIVNAWYEVMERGNGNGCSPTINAAEKNTVVEVGRIRMWVWYGGNNWVLADDSAGFGGTSMPASSDPWETNSGSYRGCTEFNELRASHPVNTLVGTSSAGRPLAKPAYGQNWHGWGDIHYHLQTGNRAIVVQQYFRKIVQNPALPDDRATTHYVAHVGSDNKNSSGGTIGGEPGVSGMREIGNDWTPVTFLSTGISEAEFISNPPPFVNEP